VSAQGSVTGAGSLRGRRWARRWLWGPVVISLSCLPLWAVGAGPARGATLTLNGEQLVAGYSSPNTTFQMTGVVCATNSSGTSSFNFSAQGTATGPIPGTFTESGTVTWTGPSASQPTVSGTLSISDTTGVVATGTIAFPSPLIGGGGTPNGGCSLPSYANLAGLVGYSVTFTSGGVTAQGSSQLNLSDYTPPGSSMTERFFGGGGNPPQGLTVEPNMGLSDNQIVSVSGSNLTPSTAYQLEQCANGSCDSSNRVPASTDTNGNLAPNNFTVHQNINVSNGSGSTPINCTTSACSIEATGGPESSPPSAQISFGVVGPPPSNTSSLIGEMFTAGSGVQADTTFAFTNVSCNVNGTSSFSYTADGTVGSSPNPNPPFPGTFHETGTITMQGATGSLLSATVQFQVTDPAQNITVTGSTTFDASSRYAGVLPNACAPSGTPTAGSINLTVPVDYSAQTKNGPDSGLGLVSISNTCPGITSNPALGICPTPAGSIVQSFGPPSPDTGHFTYTGPTWGDLGDSAVLSARVTDSSYNPAQGVQVSFGVPSALCSAMTDDSGVATCTTGPLFGLGHVGPWLFGTGSSLGIGAGPVPFLITPEETALSYTGPTLVANGATVQLSGQLHTDDGVPVPGASMTLSLGTQNCTAITNTAGTGTCAVRIAQAAGPITATAAFAGNGDHQPAQPSSVTALVAGNATGGNFVIGNQDALTGNQVTFWGAQWAKQNSLSGGSGPSSFKGFANTPTTGAVCGTQWSSNPGNSSGPPATVPAYLALIVTNTITQTGSVISGNTTELAIVKTDPGYAANPGHAGTGTVVAVFTCS